MRKLLQVNKRRLFYLSLVFAAVITGFGLVNETSTSSSASPNCGGQELAGHWLNMAKPDGSDVMAADIQIPCSGAAAAAGRAPAALTPKIALNLTVRCMHVLSCDWPTVAASWKSSEQHGGSPLLSARYDQDRFERIVTIESVDDGKLRLTLESRFKGLAAAPIKSIYTLERKKA